MRGIAGLCGATLVMLALCTCGTYRAITDDYESDAPVIQDVKPTSGVSGEEVTFEMFLCQGKAFTGEERYIWDFGGGAYPNVSYEAKPSVQLRDGQRGPYACRVTVTGGCVGDDDVSSTYEFTLNVAPLTVLTVAPTTGTGDETGTFSALIGTGNVTQYQWDFGGACSPNGSTDENPNVKFINSTVAMTYQARVIVSNNFEAYEFPFTITVQPNPGTP